MAKRIILGEINRNAGTHVNDGKIIIDEQFVTIRRRRFKTKASLSLKSDSISQKKQDGDEITEPIKIESLQHAVEQISEPLKSCEITDIDADDHENPQLCAEYANEIHRYLLKYEKELIVRDYMKHQKEVTEKMRAILVDWLVQIHEKFLLLQETLYLTVALVDRYLFKENVPRNELQLVGVTAMHLASKYEEIYAPEIGDYVFITDEAYDKPTIRKTESKMLAALDYRLCDPLCTHFLRRNSKAAASRPETHTMAKYFMELMLVDYKSLHFVPSMRAAAALYLSLKLLDKQDWDKTLEHYSTYSERKLKPCVRRIAELAIKAKNKDSKLTAVTSKYAKKKCMKVSQSPLLSMDQLFHFV